jgi:hypothetical protein
MDILPTSTTPAIEPIEQPNKDLRAIDVATCKMLEDLFNTAAQYRKKFDFDWQTRKDYYHGKQWPVLKPNEKKDGNKSRPILNIIRSTIQTLLPMLTDARPGINIIPSEPNDFQFSQMIDEVIRAWWDNSSQDFVMLEVLFDSMVTDVGIMKTTWDPDALDGLGDVVCISCDPSDIYIDVAATGMNKNNGYVIHKLVRAVGELRMMYPDKAAEIKPDTTGPSTSGDDTQNDIQSIKLVSPIDRDIGVNLSNQPGTTGSDLRKTCTLWECWLKDETTEEYDAGNDKPGFKKKYPKGRLITIIPGTKTVLQDVPAPYSHGLFPFVSFVDFKLPRQVYGEGESRALVEFQKIINKLLANQMDLTRLMSNPVWIVEDGSGTNADRITNTTGQVIKVSPGKAGAVRREFPPALQSGSLELMNWVLRQVEQISGATDVSQGRTPPGVTAAQALETLKESSNTRLRLKERNMNVSLTEWGHQMVGLIMQYYTTPRVIKITGKMAEDWPQFFEFFIENGQDGKSVAHKTPYTLDEAQQKYVQGPIQSSAPSKGMFDIKIASGTNLPFQKAQRANVSFKLFENKAIDQQELLTALDWPNQERLIQRMKQEQTPPPVEGGQGGNVVQPPPQGI